jgi:alpha-L-fucosidase
MRHRIFHSFCCILLIINGLYAQKIGGGELNPGIYTNQKALKKFQDLRFGLSIHWGPNVNEAQEISWSRGKETPQAAYDTLYKKFNPTKFNADQWVQLVEDFGMKYVLITTKHHDGFSMWHSDYSDYDMAATPFKRDIIKEVSEACTKKGILFGTYYSTLDWYHPDYQPYGHGGPGTFFKRDSATPKMDRYWIYAKNQIRELITKYNTQVIQFDGDWDTTWTHKIGSDMYLYARHLKDDILVNNRTDKGRYTYAQSDGKGPWDASIYAGDFEERERITENFSAEKTQILGKSPYPWEAWVTLDKSQWSWKPNPKLLSPEEVIVDLLKTISDNGNYLINIGPRPDGTFEPAIVENMKKVGQWVKRHASAIYGTRGGDFGVEGAYSSTKKDNVHTVFVYDADLKNIRLLNVKNTLISVKDEQGKPIKFTQKSGDIDLNLEGVPKQFVRVLTLVFK